MKFASSVPNLEISAYFLFWTGAVFYSIYHVQQASNKLPGQYKHHFSDGWTILNGRKADTTDYDWYTVKYAYLDQFLWISGHLILSEILRSRNYLKLIPLIQILVTITYLFLNFESLVLAIILCQPILFHLISKLNKIYIVWVFEVFCLLFLQYFKIENHDDVVYEKIAFIQVTVFWINLRCVCYSISKIDGSPKYSLVNFLAYCLYLPLFSAGPFVDYKEYVKSLEKCSEFTFNERAKKLCLNLGRFIFWIIFTDFALHFIYVSSITFSPKLVESFDNWTLYGFGYCMGQFFHLKYVVLYGISTTLAKFENVPVPNIPKCIGRIHLYSDMWRYFDNGLYLFLVRYMYVPLLKIKILPVFASFMCFSFIFLWHGMTDDILLWSFLNYLCVNVESAFRHVYNSRLKKDCEKYLNEAWRQRISCLLAAPLLAISAISNFYFFAGTQVGYIFFKRYFTGYTQMYCLLIFSLYCCCQVSAYWKRRELRKQKKL